MTLLALLGFAAAGALAAIDPLAAGAVFASALALAMFCARPRWLRFVAIALVLVPTLGLVRSRGANGSATAAGALSESIESGSMLNRAAATLLFAIGLWCLGMRRRGLGEMSLAPWFGLFLALVLASILWSDSPPLSLRRAVEALFIIVFALGVGGVYFGGRRHGHAEVTHLLCWASSLMSLGILGAFAARGEVHLADAAWRLGHEGTENQVAWMATVGLLLAWVTRGRGDIWPGRALPRFHLTVTGLVVLLTKSRETWMGVAAAMLAIEIIKSQLLPKRITGLLLVLAALGGLAYIPAVQQLWARGSTAEDLQSASGRTQLWESAWPLIRGNLWLGHGLGAFWTPRTILALSSHWTPTSLHNGYLDTVAEVGLIGMALIALVFAAAMREAWRLMRRGGDFEMGLAMLALFACFAVINGFASILEVFNYFPVTAMLVLAFFVSRRLRLLESE